MNMLKKTRASGRFLNGPTDLLSVIQMNGLAGYCFIVVLDDFAG